MLHYSLSEFPSCPLLLEIFYRLNQYDSPAILIDGVWFHTPFGGISRVWFQFFDFLSTPLFFTNHNIHFLVRGECTIPSHITNIIPFQYLDPLDFQSFESDSHQLSDLLHHYRFDVFCSSWITYANYSKLYSQIALVHDCIPELFFHSDSPVLPVRRKWIESSDLFVSVSRQTSLDLTTLFSINANQICWSHPDSTAFFRSNYISSDSSKEWQKFVNTASLPSRFILLPGSASSSSYKNPSVVAKALNSLDCTSTHLVVCGFSASDCVRELLISYPLLGGRIHAAGFSDEELCLVYKHALAVVVPSIYEGFGLPVIEVISSGGIPIIASSPGLIESGCEAALRFPPNDSEYLALLFQAVIDPQSRSYFLSLLYSRFQSRLDRLHPDLLPLSLLSQARRSLTLRKELVL